MQEREGEEASAGERLVLDRFLPYRLSILAENLSRAFARQYGRRFDLTIPEWRVVAVLGEGGKRTTREVIGRTRMDRVSVSRAAIRLEQKGLILRRPLEADGRAHELCLSRRGSAVYRQIVPLAQALQAELLHGFDASQRDALGAAIDTLLERAGRLSGEQEPA